MKKIDLREQGLSETAYCQKESAVRMIWMISTLLIIAVNIASSAANTLGRNNIFLDFFHTIGYAIDNLFRSYAVTSAIYLILWVLMMVVMYLISKKAEKVNINVMRIILLVLILAVILFFMMLVSEDYYSEPEERQPAFFGVFDILLTMLFSQFSEIAVAIMLVLFEVMYLGVKLAATRVFCSDKNNIRFRFLHGMPVCYCAEAFRPWQTVAIYLIPYAFLNSMLYIVNIRSNNGHLLSTLFMAFVTSFDISVVIYALRFKRKHGADYISVDRHIYEVTLFQE